MDSLIVFLIYTGVSLAAFETKGPFPPCFFPFLFKGKYYDSCTSEGAPGHQLWCSLTDSYDKDQQWRACTTNEYGGNSNGAPCFFPYIYHGRTFYTCTMKYEYKKRYWCATTGSYDKDKKWSYCADTRLNADFFPEPCIFPFSFQGKDYTACTTDGRPDGKLWCSITSNYDDDHMWIYCETSDPSPCVFPFTYKNKSYSACTKDGSFDGQLWCATTSNYDDDSKWRACALQEYGGNSGGQPCVFPFVFNNNHHEECINEDDLGDRNGRYWCSTTENYDADRNWSFCADTDFPRRKLRDSEIKQLCAFPFTYKGKSYSHCTADGTFTWKLWCSLTSNYDMDHKWRYCGPSDLQAEDNSQQPSEHLNVNVDSQQPSTDVQAEYDSQQPPTDVQAEYDSQQPPTDIQAGYDSQQPPTDVQAGYDSQQPSTDVQAEYDSQQPPKDVHAEYDSQQPPKDVHAEYDSQQPPKDVHAEYDSQQPPTDVHAEYDSQQPPTDEHAEYDSQQPPTDEHVEYDSQQPPTDEHVEYDSQQPPTDVEAEYHSQQPPTDVHAEYHSQQPPTDVHAEYHSQQPPTDVHAEYHSQQPPTDLQEEHYSHEPSSKDIQQ